MVNLGSVIRWGIKVSAVLLLVPLIRLGFVSIRRRVVVSSEAGFSLLNTLLGKFGTLHVLLCLCRSKLTDDHGGQLLSHAKEISRAGVAIFRANLKICEGYASFGGFPDGVGAAIHGYKSSEASSILLKSSAVKGLSEFLVADGYFCVLEYIIAISKKLIEVDIFHDLCNDSVPLHVTILFLYYFPVYRLFPSSLTVSTLGHFIA